MFTGTLEAWETSQYLGRILAGLDPNSKTFDTLPLLWTLPSPLINKRVNQGMEMTFGDIMEEPPIFAPVLLRCFACIVYHSDALIDQMVWCPGHDFAKLASLHDRDLLDALVSLVTIAATDGGMTERTGIPPHVNHIRQLGVVIDQIGVLVKTVATQNETFVSTITTTMEDCAWKTGHVTGDCLKKMLGDYNDDTIPAVNSKLEELQKRLISITPGRRDDTDDKETEDETTRKKQCNKHILFRWSFFFCSKRRLSVSKSNVERGILAALVLWADSVVRSTSIDLAISQTNHF